jgi:hypothetical protein
MSREAYSPPLLRLSLLVVILSASHHSLFARAFVRQAQIRTDKVNRDATSLNNIIPLHAIIYGSSGSRMEDTDDENESTGNTGTVGTSLLFEAFQAQVDPRQLVRVACAQAPPPHDQIHPSQVTDVSLVTASLNKIQVALGISPTEGGVEAVQIMVPISFDSCETVDDMVEKFQAVMDPLATAKIRDMEQRQNVSYEQSASQQALLAQLSEVPSADDVPDWWTWAELQRPMVDECTNLKRLLNEDDFGADRRRLAAKYGVPDDKDATILEARIVSIGPSGLYLRCLVDESSSSSTSAVARSICSTRIVAVAIRFASKALGADMLRTNVLKLIDDIEQEGGDEMPEVVPVEPKVAKPTTSSLEQARKQAKSPEEESLLAAKYSAIPDLGERAYTILKDLGMI